MLTSMTMLTAHFSTDEVMRTSLTDHWRTLNVPTDEAWENIRLMATSMEAIRNILGDKPIIVHSWYRCPTVNLLAGGAPKSAHLTGRAIDFSCPAAGSIDDIFETLRHQQISFDKMINEGNRWIHLQHGGKKITNRMLSFRMNPTTKEVTDAWRHYLITPANTAAGLKSQPVDAVA